MYVCYVVPFFTNKAVCMLYVCVSSDMFVFVYDVYIIYINIEAYPFRQF